MPRSILYARKVREVVPGGITYSGPGTTRSAQKTAVNNEQGDDYASKLVKFVPAEVLAFFVPAAALSNHRPGLLLAATAIASVATPAYLWLGARKLPEQARPLIHMYPLSLVAFVAWAIATTSLRGFIGLDEVVASFTLVAAVFLIPLIDGIVEARIAGEGRRPE